MAPMGAKGDSPLASPPATHPGLGRHNPFCTPSPLVSWRGRLLYSTLILPQGKRRRHVSGRRLGVFCHYGAFSGYQEDRKGPAKDRPQEASQPGQNSASEVREEIGGGMKGERSGLTRFSPLTPFPFLLHRRTPPWATPCGAAQARQWRPPRRGIGRPPMPRPAFERRCVPGPA